MRPLKKDQYYRSRGSISATWLISCTGCDNELLVYQKDGRGVLKRAYLNRIRAPEQLARLQDVCATASELHPLICDACHSLIGTPMLHWEGRLAFRLILGSWRKTVLRR
jgi:hypothetical protein